MENTFPGIWKLFCCIGTWSLVTSSRSVSVDLRSHQGRRHVDGSVQHSCKCSCAEPDQLGVAKRCGAFVRKPHVPWVSSRHRGVLAPPNIESFQSLTEWSPFSTFRKIDWEEQYSPKHRQPGFFRLQASLGDQLGEPAQNPKVGRRKASQLRSGGMFQSGVCSRARIPIHLWEGIQLEWNY